jgi:hypothetical protein
MFTTMGSSSLLDNYVLEVYISFFGGGGGGGCLNSMRIYAMAVKS